MKTLKSVHTSIQRSIVLLPVLVLLLAFLPEKSGGQDVPPPPPPPPVPQEAKLKLPLFIVSGSDTIYQMTEENAQFPGGNSAMESFRDKNLVYPPEIKNLGIRGSVTVSFIVERDGSTTGAMILRGLSPALDAEALRVTALMPAWIPGKEKGRPVRFTRSMTYLFGASPTTLRYEYPEDRNVFVVVEQMPKFPGGDAALLKYIAENVKYPEAAKTDGIQGRVIVRFCVTEKGTIDLVSILRGVDQDLDNEAIRVVKTLPAFEPGKQGGIAVPVWYSVPITYTLNPSPADPLRVNASGYNTPPSYPGGETAMHEFIRSKVVYPAWARQNKIQGKVIVNYCITPEGNTGCVSVYKGVDPLLDAEAVRVVSQLTGWQPGKLNGKNVNVYYQVAVSFKLQ
ncbi:MAG: energy transducer TonB [Bacteroidales bacterium]|jgi:TonB family protein|nr:energy transducer TonB [Bacteroidales bacterium]